MPRHIEHPASLHSNPAVLNISSKPSASACFFTSPEPGTTIALLIFFEILLPSKIFEAARKSSILELVQEPMKI